MGDRELMEYAFYNLLTNAVKYSPAGPDACASGVPRGANCGSRCGSGDRHG